MSLSHMNLDKLISCINNYRLTILILNKTYKNLGVSLGLDVLLNYRNALDHHYVKCYDLLKKKYVESENLSREEFELKKLKDHEDFIRQEANLYEHLNRGLKDGILYLAYQYCNILLYMMKDMEVNTPSKKINSLRKYLHKFKNFALDFRDKEISIVDIKSTARKELLELSVIIADFEEFMKNDIFFKPPCFCYDKAKEKVKAKQIEFQKQGHFFA